MGSHWPLHSCKYPCKQVQITAAAHNCTFHFTFTPARYKHLPPLAMLNTMAQNGWATASLSNINELDHI